MPSENQVKTGAFSRIVSMLSNVLAIPGQQTETIHSITFRKSSMENGDTLEVTLADGTVLAMEENEISKAVTRIHSLFEGKNIIVEGSINKNKGTILIKKIQSSLDEHGPN